MSVEFRLGFSSALKLFFLIHICVSMLPEKLSGKIEFALPSPSNRRPFQQWKAKQNGESEKTLIGVKSRMACLDQLPPFIRLCARDLPNLIREEPFCHYFAEFCLGLDSLEGLDKRELKGIAAGEGKVDRRATTAAAVDKQTGQSKGSRKGSSTTKTTKRTKQNTTKTTTTKSTTADADRQNGKNAKGVNQEGNGTANSTAANSSQQQSGDNSTNANVNSQANQEKEADQLPPPDFSLRRPPPPLELQFGRKHYADWCCHNLRRFECLCSRHHSSIGQNGAAFCPTYAERCEEPLPNWNSSTTQAGPAAVPRGMVFSCGQQQQVMALG